LETTTQVVAEATAHAGVQGMISKVAEN